MFDQNRVIFGRENQPGGFRKDNPDVFLTRTGHGLFCRQPEFRRIAP